MNILDSVSNFPEILDVKFIPVSKMKPLKNEIIHIGTRENCTDFKNVTSNELKMFYDLVDKLETDNFDELDFLSFNDLKTRSGEFCHKCLQYAAYREEENYLGKLSSLLTAFSSIEEFTKTEITNDFTSLMDVLDVAVAYENNIAFLYGQDEKAIEIINFFKNKFEVKILKIKNSLFSDEVFQKLKVENLKRASSHIFNNVFMEPAMKNWFQEQKSIFEENLLTTKAHALFNSLDSLSSLEFFIKLALEQKNIDEDEAVFLMKTTIMYLTRESNFILMPHLFFLARESILKKVDFSNNSSFVIIEENVDEKVLETCRSLFDSENPTLNTCEKVYNIAVNL